jgi:ubiquinone/menaquinone biosynthesis C-methylase UbiE
MLSIQEIKLMIEKLERLEQEDWQQFVTEFKNKLQSLAYTVDAYNEDQIAQLDKTLDWYQQDLDWRHQRQEELYDHVLYENIKSKIAQFAKMGNNLQNCLEIGPGYGRFLECLLSWRLIFFVDVLLSVESKIKKRINPKHHRLLRFYTTKRTECPDIPTNSCNFVFSWDTFPFFTQEHIAQYLKDIHRVILPGGYGLIHYADCNYDEDLHEARRGYWNFNTRERMIEMVKVAGFEMIEASQFRPRANYIIFKKPGNTNPVVYKITEIPTEK